MCAEAAPPEHRIEARPRRHRRVGELGRMGKARQAGSEWRDTSTRRPPNGPPETEQSNVLHRMGIQLQQVRTHARLALLACCAHPVFPHLAYAAAAHAHAAHAAAALRPRVTGGARGGVHLLKLAEPLAARGPRWCGSAPCSSRR